MARPAPPRAALLRIATAAVALASLGACATEGVLEGAQQEPTAEVTASPPPHRRLRPRRARVERALDEAAERASRCLAPGAPDTAVEGAFVGANGRFAVTSVRATPTLPSEGAECVREAFAQARVPPFRALRYDAARVVGAPPPGAVAPAAGGGSAVSSGGAAAPAPSDEATRAARERAGAVLEARAPELMACYRRQLADDGALRAWFQARFVIEADGRVSFAGASTRTLAGGPRAAMHFAECAEEVVRATTFAGVQAPRAFELLRAFMLSPEAASGGAR